MWYLIVSIPDLCTFTYYVVNLSRIIPSFIVLQLSAQELELNYVKEAEKLKEMMPDEETEDQNGKLLPLKSSAFLVC